MNLPSNIIVFPGHAPDEGFLHGYDRPVIRGPLRAPNEADFREKALLFCEGRCDRPVRHSYIGRREVSFRDGQPVHDEFIYECTACKHSRVWGTESFGQVEENQS